MWQYHKAALKISNSVVKQNLLESRNTQALKYLRNIFENKIQAKPLVILVGNDFPNGETNSYFPISLQVADKMLADGLIKNKELHNNTLYFSPPSMPTYLMKLESIEDNNKELFLFKQYELCWLLQCLGASKIEIKYHSEDALRELTQKSSQIGAEINIDANIKKLIKVQEKMNFDMSWQNNSDTTATNQTQLSRVQIFKPSSMPYIPNDLIFYHKEQHWQEIAKQRMEGDILSDSFKLSMENMTTSNSFNLDALSAELALTIPRYNVTVGANAKKFAENKTENSQYATYTIEISVEFVPKEDLIPKIPVKETIIEQAQVSLNTNQSFSQEEEKYIEMVLDFIEDDGKLDKKEKERLEAKRKSFNFDLSTAKNLENIAFQRYIEARYSKDECDFLIFVRELFEDDGKLDDLDKKRITSKQQKLGLTDGKSQQLIDFVISSQEKISGNIFGKFGKMLKGFFSK
jgi:hypothetical protein